MVEQNLVYGCSAGRFKTPERERLGKFSAPVSRDKPFVILTQDATAMMATHTTFKQLFADRGLRLLVREGLSYGAYIDNQLPSAQAHIVRQAYENQVLVQVLAKGTVDGYLMSEEEAIALISAYKTDKLAIAHFSDAPPGEYRYLYCSRQVEDAALAKINAALPSFP